MKKQVIMDPYRNSLPSLRLKILKISASSVLECLRSWWSPISFEAFNAIKFFPALDGLRAVAVLLVISLHYGGTSTAHLSGWLGVYIFFVLSGFLITTLLIRERATRGFVDLRGFYVRRVFRICPAYYVVLVLMVWRSWAMGEPFWTNMKIALPYYTVFFNESLGTGVWAPWKLTWTLGIEWKYYLVWPLLGFVLMRRNSSTTIIATVMFVFIAARWIPSTFYVYASLLLGSLLALGMSTKRGFSLIANLSRPLIGFVALLLLVSLQLNAVRLLPLFGDARLGLFYSFFVALLIPSVISPGATKALLSFPLLIWIGKRSYSLYLLQEVAWYFVFLFRPILTIPGPLLFFLVLSIDFLLADLLYRNVEIPAISAGRHIVKRMSV